MCDIIRLALGMFGFFVVVILAYRAIVALVYALRAPLNPPPQLYVNERNEWCSKPGDKQVAFFRIWLRKFLFNS